MLVSLHIPKTAGTSFRNDLVSVFGDRVLLDYDDWVDRDTPADLERNERHRRAMLVDSERLARAYAAIHGHFIADKYLGAFEQTSFVTIVRDPCQQTISAYEHALRDDSSNPARTFLIENRMTVVDFVAAFPNHQTRYFGNVAFEDFAAIGITESYDRSLRLFEAVLETRLPSGRRDNANPKKAAGPYEVPVDVRRAVERHCGADLELYRRACERFERDCRRAEV